MIVVAGKDARPCNDSCWKLIRERDGVDIARLADPSYVGPFQPGGGKGGDLMAFTTDGAFIIKELGKADHELLCSITEGYVQRIRDGQSLLVTIYLHFTDRSERRFFMVMSNILRHRGPFAGLYDLKGCADDKTLEADGRKVKAVHKRIWQMHLWCWNCLWSDDRMTYFEGKLAARTVNIPVTAPQKEAIMARLKMDTDWMANNNLMDYSLLVGIKRMSRSEFDADQVVRRAQMAAEHEFLQPLVCRADGPGCGDVSLVYIGIIDFLQEWTCGKKIAMALKVLERNKATIAPRPYAKRFYEHFQRIIVDEARPIDLPSCPEEEEDWTIRGTARAAAEPSEAFFSEDGSEQMVIYHSCRSGATTATRLPTVSSSWQSCASSISG